MSAEAASEIVLREAWLQVSVRALWHSAWEVPKALTWGLFQSSCGLGWELELWLHRFGAYTVLPRAGCASGAMSWSDSSFLYLYKWLFLRVGLRCSGCLSYPLRESKLGGELQGTAKS